MLSARRRGDQAAEKLGDFGQGHTVGAGPGSELGGLASDPEPLAAGLAQGGRGHGGQAPHRDQRVPPPFTGRGDGDGGRGKTRSPRQSLCFWTPRAVGSAAGEEPQGRLPFAPCCVGFQKDVFSLSLSLVIALRAERAGSPSVPGVRRLRPRTFK